MKSRVARKAFHSAASVLTGAAACVTDAYRSDFGLEVGDDFARLGFAEYIEGQPCVRRPVHRCISHVYLVSGSSIILLNTSRR